MRVGWDSYFMVLAKMVASRSTCNSRPTGAIIVKDKRVISTGYNGSVIGADQCSDHGQNYCFRRINNIPNEDKYNFCPAVHAEANAIAQAAKYGISIQDSVMYCTLYPCFICQKLIVNSGITKVFYEHEYESSDPLIDEYWRNQTYKIKFEKFTISEGTICQMKNFLLVPTSDRNYFDILKF